MRLLALVLGLTTGLRQQPTRQELLRGADESRVRPQVLYALGQDSRFVKQHAGARKLLLQLDQPAVEASVLVEARHLAGRVQPTRDGIDEPVDRVDRASEVGLGREVWDDDKAVVEELCVLRRSQWSRRIRRAPRRDAPAESGLLCAPARGRSGPAYRILGVVSV